MKRQILIPLDGSSRAEAAIPHALQLAQASASDLHLVRVVTTATVAPSLAWPMPAAINLEQWIAADREAAKNYLTTLAQQVQTSAIAVHTTLLEGDPATSIVAFAQETPTICEIAMATHGRSGVSRWVFGSVAEKVLHATPVPLLLVRVNDSLATELDPPKYPLLHDVAYRTIVVPLDGSDFGEQALATARVLADHYQAELVLASVVPYLDDIGLGESGVVPLWTITDQQTVRDHAAAYLKEVATRLAEGGLRVRTRWVDGPPAEMITTIAQEENADLIVMSTHGRSGFSRLWLGSVATKIIRHTSLPVLLIRAQQELATGR